MKESNNSNKRNNSKDEKNQKGDYEQRWRQIWENIEVNENNKDK